jgi:23S rRNA (guanosine2251-2'-O)-methyltransferase
VTGVVLPRHRAVHITPTVAKSAAGAIEHVPFATVGGLPAAITELQQMGVWIVGLDVASERKLWDFPMATDPVALVVGAEGRGISRLVRERCDLIVTIPMAGSLDSLNVSAAGALAMFEVTRARNGATPSPS